MNIVDIRNAITKCPIEYSAHCFKRMLERGITRANVIECINNGEIIEDYPLQVENKSAESFPSCLILGMRVADNTQIHVVVGYNGYKLLIISVYYPDLEHWSEDYKTRRK
ncbi:DUF4258 domain-containing protein [Butyrivibrio hungatei]|uniref:DUF4258 domain-containing protein n=1 Tax=Butyrivibrio hungatei TaxID=185008 RepID=A0A1D9P601_9FIRM|nr:DUF4258 domain-containing protein [Butyrivibrio hungatei]AOZ97922.1 hypothetical protein bhn_II123 [Butyrivibrio hungatei]